MIETTDRSICKADRAIPLFDLCFVRRVSMLGAMISRWKTLQADTKIINDVESLGDRDLSSNLEQRDSMLIAKVGQLLEECRLSGESLLLYTRSELA